MENNSTLEKEVGFGGHDDGSNDSHLAPKNDFYIATEGGPLLYLRRKARDK